MELGILRQASRVAVVSEHMREMYASAYPAYADKLVLLRNGYDHTDFVGLPGPQADGPFVLTYTGSFYGGRRNPRGLMEAIALLKREGRLNAQSFCFRVIGIPEQEIVAQVEACDISDLVEFKGCQTYRDTLAAMTSSTALLLIENLPEAMTTKFYEYLAARRPILQLVPPDFELARLVQELGAGEVIHPDDSASIALWLHKGLQRFQRHGPASGIDSETSMQFSRVQGASTLANVLNEMVE